MIANKLIETLNQELFQNLKGQAQATQEEMQKSVEVLLQRTFAKLDLVTREEFEAQKAVLLRTREKVDALEKLVAELEQKVGGRESEPKND